MLFGERDPVDEPGTATGSPGDWWTVTALVPDLFDPVSYTHLTLPTTPYV